MLKKFATIAALAGATMFAGSAQAGYVVYTDLASWQAAAGAHTVENFSGAALGTTIANYGPTAFDGFTLSSQSNNQLNGIANGTIANSGDNTGIPGAFQGQNYYGWGNGAGGTGPTTTLDFAAGTTAFAFNWFNTDVTDAYSVSVGGNTYNPVLGFTSTGFWGVVATAGDSFSLATIQSSESGGYVSTAGLDNVRVSAAAEVPEPASLALLGLGFAGLAFARKRRA